MFFDLEQMHPGAGLKRGTDLAGLEREGHVLDLFRHLPFFEIA
jgi:hypothetical protein